MITHANGLAMTEHDLLFLDDEELARLLGGARVQYVEASDYGERMLLWRTMKTLNRLIKERTGNDDSAAA